MRHIVHQRWNGLSNRERIVVIGLAIMTVAALLFIVVVDPLLEEIDRLDRQVAAKQRAMNQLSVLGSDYATVRAQVTQLEQRIMVGKGSFSLLSYLEEAASAAQVRDQIMAMQPHASISSHGYSEVAAELKLAGVPLSQLLMLLVRLEDSPHLLQVKRFHVKPRVDAPHRFDASLTVSTYRKE